jgi:hypothetical protein
MRGVRLRVTLGRNPMPAGQTTWLRARVTNTGRRDLLWFHDGCAIPVHVSGVLDGQEWRPGLPYEDSVFDYKNRVLWTGGSGAIWISFVPEGFSTRSQIGCADIGITDRIRPGASIRMRARWDGSAYFRKGLPPSGPVTLQAFFGYFKHAGAQPHRPLLERVLRMPFRAWIVDGRDPALLHPGEVVDAALADEGFTAWLATAHIGDASSEVFWFEPRTQLWEIGGLDYRSESIHLAQLDPRTGAIVATIDRPWDPKRDGYP